MAVLTFLSDYGYRDEFVGVVHGVIAGIAPDARIIDVTHGIPRHDVRAGAVMLARALPHMPAGIHLAVVDPGVGGDRRGVALRVRDGNRVLVGPDNGLLTAAADVFGGVVEAVEITHSPWRLEPVSATFHGRDVFAAVAARLAAGGDLSRAGRDFDPDALERLELPPAKREDDGTLVTEVTVVDAYGNIGLAGEKEEPGVAGVSGWEYGTRLLVQTRLGRELARVARAFSDVEPGELLYYQDSAGDPALAVNRGDAAGRLGLMPGDTVWISTP
ncbi:MAG: SAM-dependent chlorinase/fluorinase [Actinomycetota bacterium]|nr:SAM-dependent chlorinase/fluorinase [Actinomycetota bacterium]